MSEWSDGEAVETSIDLLTVREAAKLLRIGKNLAYRLVARGEIPSRRFGRKILIPRAELEQRFGGGESTRRMPANARRDEPQTRHNA